MQHEMVWAIRAMQVESYEIYDNSTVINSFEFGIDVCGLGVEWIRLKIFQNDISRSGNWAHADHIS